MTFEKNQFRLKGTEIISWIVFLGTVGIVMITLTSVVFPAFVMGSMSGIKFPVQINIFETGIWTYQLLFGNFIVFGLAILYFKNKLPQQITNSIKFIFNFEVSRKVAFIVIIILLVIYIPFNAVELLEPDPWIDYTRYVERTLDNWTYTEYSGIELFAFISMSLGKISGDVFGHYAVIASITSIALLVLVYLITVEISKKRFAGIVAMIIVLQSGNFLIYDSTITYPNFWVFFILLSLYTVYKKWPLSPVSFFLALGSKVISGFYLPLIIFYIFRAHIPKHRKIFLLIIYGGILVSGITIAFMLDIDILETTKRELAFDDRKFLSGLTAFAYQFRFDGLILIFLLPLTVGLFLVSRNGNKEADSILVLFMGVLLSAAFLPGLTSFTNNPYRFMPFVFFFAMGVGILLSKRPIKSA